MLAGRPHEAVSNGSPRWMAVGPRLTRVHRTRPTGRLARRPSGFACSRREVSAGPLSGDLAGAEAAQSLGALCGLWHVQPLVQGQCLDEMVGAGAGVADAGQASANAIQRPGLVQQAWRLTGDAEAIP